MGTRPRALGGPGTKWVDRNSLAIKTATQANNGITPYSPALETSSVPGQEDWSNTNLPHILFRLKIPASSGFRLKPEENPDTKLRPFEILPDQIAVNVEPWRVEAWRRTDDRIGYEDILQRMVVDPDFANGAGLVKPEANALSNQCQRQCRKPLGHWVDYSRRPDPHKTELVCLERLTFHNIKYNTVLQVCELDPTRIVKLKLVRKTKDDTSGLKAVPLTVTPQNIEETTLPIDTFLTEEQKMHGGAEMDWEMQRAFELLLTLQERVRNHGFEHTNWANMKRLGKTCLPETWFDRTLKGINKKKTYDGGCQVCGWSSPKEQLLLKMVDEDHAIARTGDTSPKRTHEDAFPEEFPAGGRPKMPQLDYHVCFIEDDDSDAVAYTTDVELPEEDSNTPVAVQNKPARRTAKKIKTEQYGIDFSSPASIRPQYEFMPPGMAVPLNTMRSFTPHGTACPNGYAYATPRRALDAEPNNNFMDITPPLNATKYTSAIFANNSSQPVYRYEASTKFDYGASIYETYDDHSRASASSSVTLPPSPPEANYWGNFRSEADTLVSSVPSVLNTFPESPEASTSAQTSELSDLSNHFDEATMYSTPSVYDGYIPQDDLDSFV